MKQRPKAPPEPYTGETVALPKPQRQGEVRNEYRPAPPPPGGTTSRRSVARKPRPTRWRRVRLALLLLLLVVIVGIGLFYLQVARLARAIVVDDARPNPTLATPLIVGANLLLIGVDERPDHPEGGVRSDTLMLVHMDAGGRFVSMLSIPRDTQVDLPGVGISKINTAYGQGYARAEELFRPGTTPQQGGMGFAAQTVETFLSMHSFSKRVDFTAQINFAGFAGLIDALGGVTIDVPQLIVDEEYPTPDYGVMRVEFQPGVQRMNGERALIYARTRHTDSDFGRIQRQQQVLRAIANELRSRGWLGRIAAVPALLRGVSGENGAIPPVLTTLPIARPDVLLSLLSLAGSVSPDDILQVRLSPDTVPVVEDGTNLIWDRDGVRALLDTLLTPPKEATEQALVQVFNGTQISGLAGTVTNELDRAGFRITIADNAPPGSYPRTIVYNVKGKLRTAKRVAETLHAEVVNTPPPEGIISTADIVVVLGDSFQQ